MTAEGTAICPCPHPSCHSHSHYRSTNTGPWECPLHEHDVAVYHDGPRVEWSDGREQKKGRVRAYIDRGHFVVAVIIDDDGYHQVLDVNELREVQK